MSRHAPPVRLKFCSSVACTHAHAHAHAHMHTCCTCCTCAHAHMRMHTRTRAHDVDAHARTWSVCLRDFAVEQAAYEWPVVVGLALVAEALHEQRARLVGVITR